MGQGTYWAIMVLESQEEAKVLHEVFITFPAQGTLFVDLPQ
jgi:hypothetical protein